MFTPVLILPFAERCDPTLICLGLFTQLAIAKNNIIKLQEENQHLRSENSLILLKSQQQFEVHTRTRLSISSNRLLLCSSRRRFWMDGSDVAGVVFFFFVFSQVTQGDVSVERDTYKHSRQGLDEMYNEARRQLKEECQLRQVSAALPPSAGRRHAGGDVDLRSRCQDVENELVAQVSMKQEMELAMKLLEKDIHEKQVSTAVSPIHRRADFLGH